MTSTNAYEFLKGQYLSQDEVAEVLKKSKDTIRRYCDAGKLKRKYDGRSPRICAFSVQRYLNDHYTEAAS